MGPTLIHDLHAGLDRATRELDAPELARLLTWTAPGLAGGTTREPDPEGSPAPGADPATTAPEPRYEDRGPLARGGMGEIRRVYDRRLDRPVVQKILRAVAPEKVARFWVEATVTARLEHPGVVPVHDFGTTEDGAPFFTMKEVRGETFATLSSRLHRASRMAWGRAEDGLTLRRAIDHLHRAAQTVAYAHSRGILHRDIKPLNLMVGPFGEVLVMDWGIALVDPRTWTQALPALDREGQVAGTPAFMAPEQARGALARQGPWTDTWSLGAVLFQLLTGRPPFEGTARDIVRQLLTSPHPDPRAATSLPLPQALATLCSQALEPDPARRTPDAAAFARALEDWLDGDRREDEARHLVGKARQLGPEVTRLRRRAQAHRADAAFLLAGLKPWDGVEARRPAWDQEDAAAALETEASQREVEQLQLVHAALTRAPELDAAHALLAEHFRRQHEGALAAGDAQGAVAAEAQLRRHDRGANAAWLAGTGQLSLDTTPTGQPVRLLRYEERDRRLVPVDSGIDEVTPIHRLVLPAGSWLVRVQSEAGPVVDLPVRIERDAHADGIRPGDPDCTPVPLPLHEPLGPEDHCVPAGWCSFGDPLAQFGLARRRVWVDGFVMRRHPVTNAEYLAFLNDLVDQGQADRAWTHVPRDTTGDPHREGRPVYRHGADGRWSLGPDATGDEWLPRWPVFLVTWHDARAYAAWVAERSGLPWRLPWEVEWEKAAAGADARAFPWGAHAERCWFRCDGSRPGRSLPATVDEHAEDVSPYGIRGLAGNVRDWVLDASEPDGPAIRADGLWSPPLLDLSQERRVSRGGSWSGNHRFGRCGTRFAMPAGNRLSVVGFRLCRDLCGTDPG